MVGGLDAADVSTSEVDVAGLHGILHTSTLPLAQHDAQAATLGDKVYVFGGGSATELSHILSYDPTGDAVTQVGALAVPQSDVAVTQAGSSAYIVGGFDGTNYLNTVVRWQPGSAPVVVGHLPVGLRYAAVAAAGGGLLIIGGSTPSAASSAIYRFDLTTHQVRQIGTLRHPITHGNAAVLGSMVYLVGGRGDLVNAQTPAVWAISPVTGHVTSAGRLPTPTSDAAVTTVGGAIVVAGGMSPTTTLGSVGELVPASG
jgi:N-acetylneuraminic acid mutarotase